MKCCNTCDIEPDINSTSFTLFICRITSEYALLSVESSGFFCWVFAGFFCLNVYLWFLLMWVFMGFIFLCKVMVGKEH